MQGGWGDDSAGGWGEPAAAGSGWGQDNPLAGAADEDDDPLALLGALDDLSIPMPSGGSPMPSEASPSPRLLPPPPPPKQPGFGAPAPAPPAEQVGLPAPPARPDANTASDNTSDPATDTNRANGRNGTLRESFSPSGGNAAAATAPRRPGLFDDSADKSGGGGGGGGGGGAHGAPELTFLFKSNGFPGSMHDQKILNLCYTVLRISTSLLLLLFMVIIVRLASYDDPSAAYDMTRSVLAVLSLGFTTVITIWSQRTMFWRHRGHATRFGLVQQFISVQRTTAERFGRMVFWPIITSFILVILWVLFSYFELIPDRKTEQDAWVRRDFSGVGVNKSGWSQFIFYLMIFLIVIQMLLLPVVSWMSLITYEAHMKDPVELLSILLIEEQRLTRKLKLPADGGGDGGPEPLNKRRRPEMAQTRAARLVARGRPPPKALLDRQMKRVETWLAQSLRWRKLLHWVTTGLETLAYYNCYIIHQQIDGKEMAAHASCSMFGVNRTGYPGIVFVTMLVVSGSLGYRLCLLSQHSTEVPRVVLNQGRGIAGVKSCKTYIKMRSAESLNSIVREERNFARRQAFEPYKVLPFFMLGVAATLYAWTGCYYQLHNFKSEYLWDIAGTAGVLVLWGIFGFIRSTYTFLCYHRLLLIEYCIEQRGKLEVTKTEATESQDKRELLGKVFVSWRDLVHGGRT